MKNTALNILGHTVQLYLLRVCTPSHAVLCQRFTACHRPCQWILMKNLMFWTHESEISLSWIKGQGLPMNRNPMAGNTAATGAPNMSTNEVTTRIYSSLTVLFCSYWHLSFLLFNVCFRAQVGIPVVFLFHSLALDLPLTSAPTNAADFKLLQHTPPSLSHSFLSCALSCPVIFFYASTHTVQYF